MTEDSSKPDDDEKIPHLENFLRPFEKLSREELDEMFAKARKCIESDAERNRQLTEREDKK